MVVINGGARDAFIHILGLVVEALLLCRGTTTATTVEPINVCPW